MSKKNVIVSMTEATISKVNIMAEGEYYTDSKTGIVEGAIDILYAIFLEQRRKRNGNGKIIFNNWWICLDRLLNDKLLHKIRMKLNKLIFSKKLKDCDKNKVSITNVKISMREDTISKVNIMVQGECYTKNRSEIVKRAVNTLYAIFLEQKRDRNNNGVIMFNYSKITLPRYIK